MRKSHISKAAEEEQAIDLTPMLDVVFIMLIFFIVTASFVKEAGIDVNRPEATNEVSAGQANILIAVSANDEIWLDRRRIDKRAVKANVARMRAENPKGTVVIQADGKATVETLAAVADGAIAAGVPRNQIIMATAK